MPYWSAGTVYGTLLNFRNEVAALAPQMTLPPYKAPPQAPVLFVKTANTWSASGAAVPVPVPEVKVKVEVGANIAMVVGPAPQWKRFSPFSHMDIEEFAIINIAYHILMNDIPG